MTLSPLEAGAWGKLIERFTPQPEIDVFGQIEYEPTPRQRLFHDATEFDVLFGGAAGGGKTKALVADDLRDAVRYPGIRIGAFRRTYGELKESLLAELAQFGYGQALGARWNGTEYELRFPNGSLIMYRYAENIPDATRRQGGQYQKLTFDERNLTSPEVITFLESRLRSGRKDLPVIGIRSGTNPGGVGHGASRDRYIDATNYGERVITDIRGRTVRFIPSKLSDNPHVNPEYAMDLMGLPDAMRAAFLDGNWDAFAGAMFPELNRDRHVIQPIDLPSSWRRYNGVDWGFTAPWAVLWAAVDKDGRVWIYRELYERQVGEADQAKRVLAAERPAERVSVRFADDAMWATRGDAKPIAHVYAEHGVHLTRAGKGAGSRVHGWQRIRSYLDEAPACPHHRAQGWTTCPRLHLFSTCTETFKELRDLPHAVTGDPEDADSRAPDHAADALRYLAVNLETPPPADLMRPISWRYWTPMTAGGTCAGRAWRADEAWRFGTVYLPHGDDAVFDHAVACAWAYTLGGDLVLLDRARMPALQATAGSLLAELSRRYTLDAMFLPKRQSTEPLQMDARRAGVHLSLIDVDADRLARALPAAEMVTSGHVWLPADTGWTREWVAECATFPANQTAGCVEALSTAVRVANTRWVPPPRRTDHSDPMPDPFAALGARHVNLMSEPL